MKLITGNFLIALFALLLSVKSYSQDTAKGAAKPVRHVGMTNPLPVFPRFPGGSDSLAAFIKSHTHYPKLAKAHNFSGEVEVYFTVAIDGSIEYARVLNRIGYGCDEEAVRIVNLMPKWQPAMQGNKPIQLDYHVTVPFGNQQIINK